eukprot:CAMPEP_0172453036 /NCGR_PEP_ID=MMETSP1065-20121228/10521_1 /TAXON_ID=265537 /ORGANISM="Amphiprora paludosa, Strain CCMP125" /LENGTH=760 /DNA_ID=CAMNT_0013205195 /DNA_START=951 /DNA_END=3233 /DNA_ORIENTATION=+
MAAGGHTTMDEPQNPNRNPNDLPKIPQPSALTLATRNTTTDTNRTYQSTSSRRRQRPVYSQYIRDRVSGVSYVPREHRPTMNDHDTNCNDHVLHEQDPTDCLNRPPHFFCFVPICVRRWPWLCEQNPLCQRQGRIGFHQCGVKQYHARRRPIFMLGFFLNFLALGFTLVASMAFSRNYNLLTHTSFTRGTAIVPQLSNTTGVKINIGFRAIATNDPISVTDNGEHVVTFNNFCDDDDGEPKQELLQDSVCGSCRESSQSFVLSCVLNIIFILRNMFSDITRMYPRYDLNCPKCTGSLMSTLSFFLGLYTILLYQHRCFRNFDRDISPEQFVNFNETLASGFDVFDADSSVAIKFRWTPGPGLTCLILGTFFRLGDAICNFIVPTPSITRDFDEQEQYEADFGDLTQFRKKGGYDDHDEEDGSSGDEGATQIHDNVGAPGSARSARRPPRNLAIPTVVEQPKSSLAALFQREKSNPMDPSAPFYDDPCDDSLTEEGSIVYNDAKFVVSGDYRHKEEPLSKEEQRALSTLNLENSHHSSSPLARMLTRPQVALSNLGQSMAVRGAKSDRTSSAGVKDNSPYGTATTASSKSSDRFEPELHSMDGDEEIGIRRAQSQRLPPSFQSRPTRRPQPQQLVFDEDRKLPPRQPAPTMQQSTPNSHSYARQDTPPSQTSTTRKAKPLSRQSTISSNDGSVEEFFTEDTMEDMMGTYGVHRIPRKMPSSPARTWLKPKPPTPTGDGITNIQGDDDDDDDDDHKAQMLEI